MDKIKTKVLKSKSSNATISKEYRKQDKKSRSNAEIQQLSVKKRGVYVEKKSTKTSMTDESNVTKKPKVIPRPDRKRFLNSILTILSKSTTGTQFPDLNEKPNKTKAKKKKAYEDSLIGDLNSTKKQPKYRSKVLNEYVNLDLDKVVVLQSKKDIIQTPSNYSQRSKDKESIKWSDFMNKNPSDLTVLDPKTNDKHVSLIEHIESGKNKLNEKRSPFIANNDDPVTLVASDQKDDNKLYDFFVDLLESTFNVYNMKTKLETGNTSSKLVLELSDSVEKTSNSENSRNHIDMEPQIEYNPKRVYHISDDWDNKLLDDAMSVSLLRDISEELPVTYGKPKRKLKSESFSYKKKKITPVTRSFIYQSHATPPKKTLKKDRKKNLLNLLKEQLTLEDYEYEPPRNFFESLQIMAKYKKRCQKSIHFDESTKKASEVNLHDCMFKRRRLLSTTSKNSYRSTPGTIKSLRSFSRKSMLRTPNKSRTDYGPDSNNESRLSLAVYNYDYDYDITQHNANNEKQNESQHSYEPSAFSSESTVFGRVLQSNESFTQW